MAESVSWSNKEKRNPVQPAPEEQEVFGVFERRSIESLQRYLRGPRAQMFFRFQESLRVAAEQSGFTHLVASDDGLWPLILDSHGVPMDALSEVQHTDYLAKITGLAYAVPRVGFTLNRLGPPEEIYQATPQLSETADPADRRWQASRCLTWDHHIHWGPSAKSPQS